MPLQIIECSLSRAAIILARDTQEGRVYRLAVLEQMSADAHTAFMNATYDYKTFNDERSKIQKQIAVAKKKKQPTRELKERLESLRLEQASNKTTTYEALKRSLYVEDVPTPSDTVKALVDTARNDSDGGDSRVLRFFDESTAEGGAGYPKRFISDEELAHLSWIAVTAIYKTLMDWDEKAAEASSVDDEEEEDSAGE